MERVAFFLTTFESPIGQVSAIDRESGGRAFSVGQAVGDAFSAVEGVAQAVLGAAISASGGALAVAGAPTVVGTAAGVAVAAGGTAIGVHGLSTAKNGLDNLLGENNGRVEARKINSDIHRTKHTDNRHIDRNKYPEKSKYIKPNQVQKLVDKTIKSPDQVVKQRNGRVVYTKDFKRKIGTSGTTQHKVVVDPKKKKQITSYPVD